MYKTLYNHLKIAIPNYSEEGFNVLIKLVEIKQVAKKERVVEQGEIALGVNFVYKGCFQYLKCKEDGTEVVTQYAVEDHWVGDIESVLSGTPAMLGIQAMEASTVLFVSSNDFNHLLATSKDFVAFMHKKRSKAYDSALIRAMDINDSAEERYLKLVKRYPGIELRVPSYSVASYLGITPESFSRLRKSLLSK